MFRRNIDILAALALTAASLLVVLGGVPAGVLRALVTLPMALVVPGYLLSLALFPSRVTLDAAARAATVIGLNLASSVIGAVLLHLTPWGLQSGSWALWLGLVSLGGSVAALVRRQTLPYDHAPRLRRLSWRPVLYLGMLATLAASALLIAIACTVIPRDEPFTQLWLLADEQDGAEVVRIGIHNGEGRTTTYRLVLLADAEVVREWSALVVPRGRNIEWVISTTEWGDAEELRAELYLAQSPDALYRHVHLRSAVNQPRPAP